MNYTMPSEVLDYNGPLFERAGLPVPTAGQYGAEGFIFNDFNLENENWFALGSRYFSPSRMPYQDMVSGHASASLASAMQPLLCLLLPPVPPSLPLSVYVDPLL